MIRYYQQGDTFYIIPGIRVLTDELEPLQHAFVLAMKANIRYLLVDCCDLEQICIPALRFLIGKLKELEENNIQFGLFGFRQKVLAMLQTTGLNTWFVIAENEAALRRELRQAIKIPATEI